MYNEQGIYHVDIVMCIDATGSMRPCINAVKESALTFYESFTEEMAVAGKDVAKLRIKVIAFRDFGAVHSEAYAALEESPFFELPEDAEAFKSFVEAIRPKGGGGDGPESALEAIATAMKSDFTTEGMKQRHVILVFTDAAALPLDKHADKEGYPVGMPKDLAELGAWWEGESQEFSGTYKRKAGRLVAFAPKKEPWTVMESWNRYWPAYTTSVGLADVDMATVFDLLVGSC